MVKGVAGVGKTAICCQYYKMKNEHEHFLMPFINLTDCSSKADFVHAICNALELGDTYLSLYDITDWIRSKREWYDAFYFDNWEDLQCSVVGTEEWMEIYSFVNTLASNQFIVLISSQESAPGGWNEIPVGTLLPEDGRRLFTDLLSRRGKDIRSLSSVEQHALENLLINMENHPLTIVLTSSLIEGPHDSLERIEHSWDSVHDRTFSKRHQSLEIALKLSFNTLQKTEGAIELWGLLAELSTDFPKKFIDIKEQISPKISWENARSALYRRSLIQFTEGMRYIHMLIPVKAQWEKLVLKETIHKCLLEWSELLTYTTKLPSVSHDTVDCSSYNQLKDFILFCMPGYMKITQRLITEEEITLAEKCIEAMKEYYEPMAQSAYDFLHTLPLKQFSVHTRGVINQCMGDICRLSKKEQPHLADGYYIEALNSFEQCLDTVGQAEVMDGIGKNMYWSFREPEKALDWLKKSEKLSRSISYNRGIAEVQKDKGIILTEEYGSYDKAIICYVEARKLFNDLKDYKGIAHVIKREGVILWKQGNIQSAVEKYENALHYYEKARFIQGQADTISRLCLGYLELHEIDSLKETIDAGKKIVDKIPYLMTKGDLVHHLEKSEKWIQEQEA